MTMTMIDLSNDAEVSQALALEAINAAADATDELEEAAHLQAAEDLLAHSRKVHTAIETFWLSVPDNAWSWDANDMVSVKGVA